MNKFIIGVIILICLIYIWTKKEHMIGSPGTKIRRTVGVINTADETHMGGGIIASVPIMDMTHTYWNGSEHTSCDECPNPQSCPKCPKYREAFDTHIESSSATYVDNIPEVESGECMRSVQDFDTEFTSSREKMGAHTSGCLSSNRSSLFTTGEELGKTLDDEFDVDRSITLGRKAHKQSDASTVRMLYTDTMGLNISTVPTPADCEYMNETGYIYKEECN